MCPRLVNGKVMIPTRLENSSGDIIDAFVELLPSDPDYIGVKLWLLAQKVQPI